MYRSESVDKRLEAPSVTPGSGRREVTRRQWVHGPPSAPRHTAGPTLPLALWLPERRPRHVTQNATFRRGAALSPVVPFFLCS